MSEATRARAERPRRAGEVRPPLSLALAGAVLVLAAFLPIFAGWSVAALVARAFAHGLMNGLVALTSAGGPALLGALFAAEWLARGRGAPARIAISRAAHVVLVVFCAHLVVFAWAFVRAGVGVMPLSLLGFSVVVGLAVTFLEPRQLAAPGVREEGAVDGEDEPGGAAARAQALEIELEAAMRKLCWLARWSGIAIAGAALWLRLQLLDGLFAGWAVEVHLVAALALALATRSEVAAGPGDEPAA